MKKSKKTPLSFFDWLVLHSNKSERPLPLSTEQERKKALDQALDELATFARWSHEHLEVNEGRY